MARIIVSLMQESILYMGDTALDGAASYLAGVMHSCHISFNYLPSDEKFLSSLLALAAGAVIISDYPAKNFSSDQLNSLAQKVAEGMGLLMIGGWESFTGAAGNYNKTVISSVLPVVMQDSDDRVNCFQPCLVEKAKDHVIVDSLPFEKCPPCIGGFNTLTAKSDAQTILFARRFNVSFQSGSCRFRRLKEAHPLLVIGSYGAGRVCAFATDVAPHWVGGLVDWGDRRIEAHAPGANPVEVGNWYADLLANMVGWTAHKL